MYDEYTFLMTTNTATLEESYRRCFEEFKDILIAIAVILHIFVISGNELYCNTKLVKNILKMVS